MHSPLAVACVAAVVCLLLATVTTPASAAVSSQPKPTPPPAASAAPNSLVVLTDANWQQVLAGEWMIQFHAPWCPACRAMVEGWNDLARSSRLLNIQVAKADVTMSPALSGRFFITALPTILHVKDGEFRQYRGPRDAETLQKMIGERKWHHMEPISAWKHPNSVQMTVVAYFFRLSHTLKETNTYLQEHYKMPVWLTYALFALVTITLGAVIGLMFVCIVDYIAPPRRKSFEELERDGEVHDYAPEDLDVDEPRVFGGAAEDAGTDDDDASTSDGEKNSDEDEDSEEERERLAEERKQRIIETKFKIMEGTVKVVSKAERIAKAEAKAAAEAAAKEAAEVASAADEAVEAAAVAPTVEQNVTRKRKTRKAD